MNYEIRAILPGEAAELKRLAGQNFSFVEQLFISKPKSGIVAQTEDGSIAGSAFLAIVETGRKKIGCIDIMFVLPKYRGSGVAKQLYQSALEMLHRYGCETVMAFVRGDNSQSLRRFETIGLYPISLHELRKQIGFSSTAALFFKTADLACATGCWILCENATPNKIGGSTTNMLRTFLVNGLFLLCGAILRNLLHIGNGPWWNLLAALSLLAVITLGESLGRKIVGGNWRFVLPEGGLILSTVVALLGGFYPMIGHWYLTKRENTKEYQKRMAAPAIVAWILLIVTVAVCNLFCEVHLFCRCGMDMGKMLLFFYMLPFYPFDTFGSRRVREYNGQTCCVLTAFSIIMIAYLLK